MADRPIPPLTQVVSRIIAVTDAERDALDRMTMRDVHHEAGAALAHEGDKPRHSCIVNSGFLIASKTTLGGRRQIIGTFISGDMPDMQSLHLATLDMSLASLSPAHVGYMAHDDLWSICAEHPRIAAALWRHTLINASIHREWILNVGQRAALPRMAHFLCECLARAKHKSIADGNSCEMPLTQADLAYTLGLSTVHVNRTLQELRRAGLVQIKDRRLDVLNWAGLVELSGFDTEYLHLHRHPRLG